MSAFTDWMEKHQRIVVAGAKVEKENGLPGLFASAYDAMEIAWDAALEAAARAQCPMLRDMISRGKAADNCRALMTQNEESATR